ncbi:MAG: cell surface protein SprA [Calditrichia bacterium]
MKLNGRVLQKDKDYTIDYFGGSLQVLAPEARRADADIEIEYERGSLFQLDKKTLLGGRMEYSFGERGFVGLTGLYLNKTTLDQRVRLGQEPVRNLIWDLNTALEFRPNFITKTLDFLPVVETSADSRLKLEAEYAEVSPNPNTFNEPSLNEENGVAYIDDFEGSERTTPLGILYRTWNQASVPALFYNLTTGDSFRVDKANDSAMYKMDRSRLRLFWYNPFNQVPIKDIWPNKDVNAQTGTTTNVLVMQWQNDTIPQELAWGGIMRSTASFPDQKKTKFIELWVKGDVGQVNVDIGKISEDFYIKQGTFTFDNRNSLRNLNSEDQNLNGLLDQDEDTGYDGVFDGNPNDDPWDNWIPPLDTDPPFLQINGTEGNGEAKGAKYPDTEDLDGDGGLDQTNEYFTYNFDLSDAQHPYIQGATNKGWRLYRIPIRNYDPALKVGKPDTSFQEIYYVRLWMSNLPMDGIPHGLQIAAFDFVGNEWEEVGVKTTNSNSFMQDDSLFNISVYNTEENVDEIPGGPEPYHSPNGVSGIRDRITKALSKEQALVMQLNYLEPGAVAEANKQLYEKMDLIHYKNLRMFVHGDRKLPETDPPLEFYIRFGPTESIYYEVGGKVFPHWDERNNLDVVMDELAKTKDDAFLVGDSLNGQPVYYRKDPSNPTKYFKVVGLPNLRNINFINIGARNASSLPVEKMEIWLDEMRVTGVERDKGVAMRLSADLTMADVASFRAQWEVVDSDFRRIEDQYGTGSTTEKQNYRAGLKVDKFFPSSWGLNIPVNGGYVRTLDVPKYYYNSDKLTNYKADGLQEKFEQFFGLSNLTPELEKNSRISETKSLGSTLQRKSSQRTPWYLKYSIDMFTLDVDWAEKTASDERNLHNDSETLSGQLQMRVPFGKDNFVTPFSWLGNGPIVRKLAEQKVYYTPSNMDMSLSIRDNESIRQSRLEQQVTKTVQTSSARKFSTAYNLFPSLNMNFSRDYQSDAYEKGYRADELIHAIITDLDFGVDKTLNQTFNANYNPKFFSWLTQSFKYSSGFNYNLSNVNTNERSSRLQVSKQVSVALQPTAIANKIYTPGRSAPNRRTNTGNQGGGPRRGSGNVPGESPGESGEKGEQGGEEQPGGEQTGEEPTQKTPEGEENQQQGGKQKGGPSFKVPNPAKLIWYFFNAWKSISLDYRLTDNYSYFNIDGIPTFNHMMGFTKDPGVGTDTSFNKIPRIPAIKHGKNVSGNLDFDIIRNLQSSFKYNYTKDINQNNQQKTENVSGSYFFLGDDPDKSSKDWYQYIPDWQLRLTGVENWFFFSKVAKSISLEHQRSGKFNETSRFDENGKSKDNWGFSNNYSPFLGINVNTNWGINGNFRYTKSTTFNYNATGGDTKSLSSGFDVTLSFSKSGGFKIPLPFLNKKRLKNEMQFSLNVNSSSSTSFAKRPSLGSDKFIEQDKNNSFKLRPSITYRFSQKVNGSMFVEYSSNETKRTGKYSYFEFGINVNIAIR